jgi:hypothetical protein
MSRPGGSPDLDLAWSSEARCETTYSNEPGKNPQRRPEAGRPASCKISAATCRGRRARRGRIPLGRDRSQKAVSPGGRGGGQGSAGRALDLIRRTAWSQHDRHRSAAARRGDRLKSPCDQCNPVLLARRSGIGGRGRSRRRGRAGAAGARRFPGAIAGSIMPGVIRAAGGIKDRQMAQYPRCRGRFDPGVVASGTCFRGRQHVRRREHQSAHGFRACPAPSERTRHWKGMAPTIRDERSSAAQAEQKAIDLRSPPAILY